MHRRSFLRASTAAILAPALGGLLTSCGTSDGTAGASGPQPPGSRKVTLGFIALTDCASIVMAKELGYFAERGLDVSVVKQASWPATRDALLNGQIDGAHCLFTMPYSVATGLGGPPSTALKVAMMLNNNGQSITLSNKLASAGYADLEAAREALQAASPTLAMTFPGGTHDTWLRYWLKATKVDPSILNIIPIPPPEMVANMEVGTMDGFCVGEPWNAVAVRKDVGFTHLNTQDLWTNHPEKALVVGERFAAERAEVLRDVMGAVLQASAWLDDLANRASAAVTLGGPAYVNAPPAEIEGRLLGRYDLGADLPEKTYAGDFMQFSRGGAVNPPRRAHGVWAMAQYQRFGLLDEAPPYLEIADSITRRDLYEEVAAVEGLEVPDDDMAPFEIRLDAVTFDPARPDEEASRP